MGTSPGTGLCRQALTVNTAERGSGGPTPSLEACDLALERRLSGQCPVPMQPVRTDTPQPGRPLPASPVGRAGGAAASTRNATGEGSSQGLSGSVTRCLTLVQPVHRRKVPRGAQRWHCGQSGVGVWPEGPGFQSHCWERTGPISTAARPAPPASPTPGLLGTGWRGGPEM